MTQVKLTAYASDRDAARTIAALLSETLDPPPLALADFERGTGFQIDAYYEDNAAAAPAHAVLAAHGHTATMEIVPDLNWVALSQAALPPVEAGRFIVHGSHDRARCAGLSRHAIEIDAGEAFGTAHHATTLGCLIALDRLAHTTTPRRVLDLGCGSGVLAIAAARLWSAAAIAATDIDPIAIDVARSNIVRNRAHGRVHAAVADGLGRTTRRYDLIVANILAGPLNQMAKRMARAVAPGGHLILSGILAAQAADVRAHYRAAGFTLRTDQRRDGWAILMLHRPNARPVDSGTSP